MTPKVVAYDGLRAALQGYMRTSNAIQRQRHRIERLENLLYRAQLQLDLDRGHSALVFDIKNALAGKRGRPGRRKEPCLSG